MGSLSIPDSLSDLESLSIPDSLSDLEDPPSNSEELLHDTSAGSKGLSGLDHGLMHSWDKHGLNKPGWNTPGWNTPGWNNWNGPKPKETTTIKIPLPRNYQDEVESKLPPGESYPHSSKEGSSEDYPSVDKTSESVDTHKNPYQSGEDAYQSHKQVKPGFTDYQQRPKPISYFLKKMYS